MELFPHDAPCCTSPQPFPFSSCYPEGFRGSQSLLMIMATLRHSPTVVFVAEWHQGKIQFMFLIPMIFEISVCFLRVHVKRCGFFLLLLLSFHSGKVEVMQATLEIIESDCCPAGPHLRLRLNEDTEGRYF